MTDVSIDFHNRWASGLHIGGFRPVQVVEVRKVRMNRGWNDWHGPTVNAVLPKESAEKPWMSWWTPESPWVTIPGVMQTEITQDFSTKGIGHTTIEIENVLYREANNLGFLYHLIERGALSPWRGYNPPGLPPGGVGPNEWYEALSTNRQIRIWQGYGDDTLIPVFTGLIDDVDPVGRPDKITVTCRDFGQVLTDEKCFGNVNGPNLIDPVIFRAKKPNKDNTVGKQVGYGADASSSRAGYPPRFAEDYSPDTRWISGDREAADRTEWVSIRVPKGRYESFRINLAYPNMEVYVGIYARKRGISDQEPCELDGMNIKDGWVQVPADEGGGTVPGTQPHGDWPYIKKWTTMSQVARTYKLDHILEVGDDTVIRVGFRRLHRASDGGFRASVIGLKGIRQEPKRKTIVRYVGYEASSSSHQSGFHSPAVLDDLASTEWHSEARNGREVTEWIQIRIPQGRYNYFRLFTDVNAMEMFVGVYARPRRRKKGTKKNTYEYYPSQMGDVDVAEGWLHIGMGEVPGEHGGWPFIKYAASVEKMDKKSVAFQFPHELELGPDSVIRVGFRHLHPIGGGKFRAIVGKLHGQTRSGVAQPPPTSEEEEAKANKRKIVEVDDPSDIVRVVLRWAGFQEWSIENTGAKLEGDWIFNRQTALRDIIAKVEEMTGYVFYMAPPTEHDLSVGIPTFRSSFLLRDDLPNVPYITEDMLLGSIQAKTTDEPLSTNVRVRGALVKKESGGKAFTEGADKEHRLQAFYRPPWWPLGGVLRHVVHYEPRLTDQVSVDVMSRLIALKQALESTTATIEIPGTPEYDLDWQVALRDSGTGLNTRLYVARRSTVFVSGEKASYKTTLGGALLDTPWVTGVKQSLAALVPPGAAVSSIGDILAGVGSD